MFDLVNSFLSLKKKHKYREYDKTDQEQNSWGDEGNLLIICHTFLIYLFIIFVFAYSFIDGNALSISSY